jgi:hypothetical protein
LKNLVIFLLIKVVCTYSTTYYVSKFGNDSNDGLSWQKSFGSFQKAFDISQQGDQVWIGEGTYYPTYDFGLNIGTSGKHLRLKNGVEFYGGFAGDETILNERDFSIFKTILSGDVGIPNDSTDNVYHVFYHPYGTDLNVSALLDGFVISDGNASSGDGENRFGAGMYNWTCSPSLRNCVFENNYASGYLGGGGGIYNTQSSKPIVDNCEFKNNTSAHNGAGIYNIYYSHSQITNCTFTGNYCQYGAAIFNNRSNAIIEYCNFKTNTTYYGGGAISIIMANTVVKKCVFDQNNALGTCGGTIWIENNSSPVISDCLFTNNTIVSDTYGPGYGWGGALYMYNNSDPNITNCTIVNNSANFGGGIFVRSNTSLYPDCNPIIANCVIYGNSASTNGNQICVQNTAEITVTNSCYSMNMYDVSGTVHPINCIYQNPQFSYDVENPFSLSLSSPCIDTGNNSFCLNEVDILNNPRVWDGNDDGAEVVDMGSYELQIVNSPRNMLLTYNLSSIELNWSSVIGAYLYRIYRSDNPYSGFIEIDTSFVPEYIDNDISGSDKYFYKVTADNGTENKL